MEAIIKNGEVVNVFATLEAFFDKRIVVPSVDGFDKEVRFIAKDLSHIMEKKSLKEWEKLFLYVVEFAQKYFNKNRLSQEERQKLIVLEMYIEDQTLEVWKREN